jgi:hypothetical protein
MVDKKTIVFAIVQALVVLGLLGAAWCMGQGDAEQRVAQAASQLRAEAYEKGLEGAVIAVREAVRIELAPTKTMVSSMALRLQGMDARLQAVERRLDEPIMVREVPAP